MPNGEFNHIRLAVSDLSQSAAFYTYLMAALGYRVAHRTSEIISFHHRTSPLAFILSQAIENKGRIYSRHAPGLHHLAFHASSKEDVDRIYRTCCHSLRKFEFLIRHANVRNTALTTMRYFSKIVMG
jgi:glyoxylase I family protein